MKFIKSFKDIIDKYDVFIIDQWGVMHDGIYGYKHAIKSIDYLKTKDVYIWIRLAPALIFS